MARPKEKPEEAPKRSPGRSRFAISRKESPQIDGSYLDRLFADFQQQQQSAQSEQQTSSEVAAAQTELVSGGAGIANTSPPATGNLIEENLSHAGAVAKVTSLPAPAKDIPFEPKVITPASRSRTTSSPPSVDVKTDEIPTNIAVLSGGHVARLDSQDSEDLLQKVARTSRLAPGEINILRVMVQLCRERGSDTCYVKIPQLMGATGLSDRQTQRVLKNLHGLDLIEKLADYSNADRLGTLFRLKIQLS